MAEQQGISDRRRIFISYGHDVHKDLAVRLKNDLTAAGYEIWFDMERIVAGKDWENYIEDGLDWVSQDKKGCLIVIMTPHSVRRPDGFCLNELARAISKNLRIIPIMLEWCEVPLSICRIQWLDMQDCIPLEGRQEKYEIKFKMLIEALSRDLLDFEGSQQMLLMKLRPLSFDAEIKYNLNKFTGREWVFKEIDRWMSDESASPIFWILGGPGVGKTAIASYLCAHMPEIAAFHFCRYDNIQKSDARRCITSIAYQLCTQLLEYEERLKRADIGKIDDLNAKTLFDQLIVQPLSSGFPVPDKKIVIIIDALDEATIDGKNELVRVIASEFERAPRWMKFIITSRPTAEVIGPLQGYSPFVLEFSDPRNEKDISSYLSKELKNFETPLSDIVVDCITKKSSGLFLYAEWVVRELKNGRLSVDRLDDFPQGLGGIYLNFFERQFPDVAAWETAIRPALEILAAAREPITLKQLSAILGWNVHDERKFRQTLGSLYNFDGGIKPFHKSVIDWLTSEEKEDPYFISLMVGHQVLADYGLQEYRSLRWNPYIISYLPAHLFMAGRAHDLEAVLLDLAFVRAAWDADKFRLMGIWTTIEESSTLHMDELYRRIDVKDNMENSRGLFAIMDLLKLTSHFEGAMRILRPMSEYYRENHELTGLSECLSAQAWILTVIGESGLALATSIEHESVSRSLNDTAGVIMSLHNQAHVYYNMGDYHNVMAKGKEIEKLSREIGDIQGLERALNLQALVLMERDGDYDRALDLLKETEAIDREHGRMNRLSVSLSNQGECMRFKGEYNKALNLYKEAESIHYSLGERQGLATVISNEGLVLQEQGKLNDALAAYNNAEKIFQEINNKSGIAYVKNFKGQALYIKGKPDEAMVLYKDAESINRAIGYKMGLQLALGNQAIALNDMGDLARAMALSKEREEICLELGLKKELKECRELQASIQGK